jgi:two-component system alkaline phosphatase synthesis response regulator PhoP
MENRRVLVVDDEEGIRFFLKEVLQQAGFSVTTAVDGEDALAQIRETSFDLAILDLNLGGRIDGLKVLEAVKWRWPGTAVIILTAYGTMDSALTAIQEGVEGYLLKPVEPADVRQAVRKALARPQRMGHPTEAADTENVLQWGNLQVDQKKHRAMLDGRSLKLTPNEFKLLIYFMQNAHRVLSPQELVSVVHDYDSDDTREAREIIKWYIYRLRQKIEPTPSKPRYIRNIRGVGYILGGDLSES